MKKITHTTSFSVSNKMPEHYAADIYRDNTDTLNKYYMFGESNMNFFKTIFYTLLLSGISFNVAAADKLRVQDRGMDGTERYYSVSCPDGKNSSVVVKFDMPEEQMPESGEDGPSFSKVKKIKTIEICMSSHAGKHECRAKWSVDEAAQASCP
jgi:hypothetical protein